jgi:hypothetical protein
MFHGSLDASIIPGFELADMFSFTLDVFFRKNLIYLFISVYMKILIMCIVIEALPYFYSPYGVQMYHLLLNIKNKYLVSFMPSH